MEPASTPRLPRSTVMSMRAAVAGSALVVSCASLQSCLFSPISERILEPDPARRTVRFESDAGLEQFQRTVVRCYRNGAAVRSQSEFAIPFVLHTESREVLSENAYYNEQVAKADVDGDGVLSDAECRAYAGSKS